MKPYETLPEIKRFKFTKCHEHQKGILRDATIACLFGDLENARLLGTKG